MGKNRRNTKEPKIDRLKALRESKKNLKDMEKPRKPINSSFLAKYDGDECPKCFINIEKGQRVRYDSDGFLIHVRHEVKEATYEVCTSCFLTKPCVCDED